MNPKTLLIASAVFSLWALPISAAPITPEDAADHLGEMATVCGVVASGKFLANSHSQPTVLELDRAYPNAVFTAVIFGEDRAKFGTPEKSLRGKRICVTGSIRLYRGKPEIVLGDPSQLTE